MATDRSRRSVIITVICVVFFALVYIAALGVYANSGKSTVAKAPPAQSNGIEAQIDVINVDPLRHELTARIALLPHGSFATEAGGFKRPMRVKYYFTTGESSTESHDIEPDRLYMLNEMKFLTYGNFDTYPVDRYSQLDASDSEDFRSFPAPIFELSFLDDKGNEVPVATGGSIPIWVSNQIGAPHGWSATWELSSEESLLFWNYSLKRAGGTLVFVAVVMILMAVLAIAALSVSIRVFRKPGTIEATMASWQAALLFALIPLRNFLPGSPPIGAWIDMLVFYWVILALMCSMALFTYTWLRDKGQLPGEKEARQAKKEASKVS